MKLLIIFLIFLTPIQIFSQNRSKLLVKNSETGQALSGVQAEITELNKGTVSDSDGFVEFNDIPPGKYSVKFTKPGFVIVEESFNIPLNNIPQVLIYPQQYEMQTRVSMDKNDSTTREQIIPISEIQEKTISDPLNLTILLNKITGINSRRTSPVNSNTTIQFHGLPSRFSKILYDGIPVSKYYTDALNSQHISAFGLVEVEIIRGPASVLYGNNSITGVINLTTLNPTPKPTLRAIFNAATYGGFDAGGIFTSRQNELGYTLTGTASVKKAVDANEDGFTELPETKLFTLFPKLYYYPDKKTEIITGIGLVYDERTGGDIDLINGSKNTLHTYFNKTLSRRFTGLFSLEKLIDSNTELVIKANGGIHNRSIGLPGYEFKGRQYSGFAGIKLGKRIENLTVTGGMDFSLVDFRENEIMEDTLRDFDNMHVGAYIHSIYNFTKILSLESGLRYNYQKDYGSFLLPEIAVLLQPSESIAFRLRGGMGYTAPSLFTEETEELNFMNLRPLSDSLEAETSIGGTFDINLVMSPFSPTTLIVNQLFFYTKIEDPLELIHFPAFAALLQGGNLETKGLETNLEFIYAPFKLTTGYTFTEAQRTDENGNKTTPILVPKHKLGIDILYEQEKAVRMGINAYYTGAQYLGNGNQVSDYWIMGAFAEKYFGNFSVFINLENFTNTKQPSNYIPPHNNPSFTELYTNAIGIYLNGGIRIRL